MRESMKIQSNKTAFSEILNREEYDFIHTDCHLGSNIILLGLSGSYSYGTENENSDIDIRGITLEAKSDLIGMTTFEQYVDDNTDTTIYGFNKMIRLLLSCNPNTIELLGLKPEHYLYLTPVGMELLERKQLFLSKKAVQSFGGYASQQLRRLQNALARDSYNSQEKEQHIFNSIRNAMYEFRSRYESFENGAITLYLDQSNRQEFDMELFMDVDLKHYPLRDYQNIWMEMNQIVRAYDKIGKRNKKKDDNHLNKHAMHLIRLFMMAIDILEKGEIYTYREAEQELLATIRNGGYQREDGQFRDEFYKLLSEYEKRLEKAAIFTSLPDEPDYKRVETFMMEVNEMVITGEKNI